MEQPKETWLVYLAILERDKKDWTDPTYLMQAFSLTKKRAKQVINYYRTVR